jgi:hypothetical protein
VALVVKTEGGEEKAHYFIGRKLRGGVIIERQAKG